MAGLPQAYGGELEEPKHSQPVKADPGTPNLPPLISPPSPRPERANSDGLQDSLQGRESDFLSLTEQKPLLWEELKEVDV